MSATSTQQTNDNPVTTLKPRYLNARASSYDFTILLGLENPTVAQLNAACAYLQQEIGDREATFAPRIGSDGYELYGYYGGRQQLEALVQPEFTASGSASAEVRRKDEKHVATIVRITVTDGKIRAISKKQIEEVDGVLLANWLGKGTRLSFSLVDPTEENVQQVTTKVAERLGMYIPSPVTVIDNNPEASLLPENHFVPRTNDKS